MIGAIVMGDWHLRATVPECRTDDFIAAMWNKVDRIFMEAERHGVPILIPGDLFHQPKAPFAVMFELIQYILNRDVDVYAVPGQHDLPNHQLGNWPNSAFGLLHETNLIHWPQEPICLENGLVIHGFAWGEEVTANHYEGDCHVVLAHRMVWHKERPYPGCEGEAAHFSRVCRRLGYDFVFTGDNHQPFSIDGLLNTGSMMRTTAAQHKYKPACWLWDAADCSVKPIYFDIDAKAVSRAHIEAVEQKDERLAAFVERLGASVELSLSFRTNLERYIETNEIDQQVVDTVWEIVK